MGRRTLRLRSRPGRECRSTLPGLLPDLRNYAAGRYCDPEKRRYTLNLHGIGSTNELMNHVITAPLIGL
jgi:hypothetical protein